MTTELDSFIALSPCGCLAMAIVDDPNRKLSTAREVAKAIRRGEAVSRVPSEQVRSMPWKCGKHMKGKS